ncbi:MAG: hypothetical protein K9M56_08785 [Victivallales bacterium]|nr:hypothetical protein [Victivallales bacterium]
MSINSEEASVIAGAVGGFLGHSNFKILSIEEIADSGYEQEKNRLDSSSLLSRMSFRKPKD